MHAIGRSVVFVIMFATSTLSLIGQVATGAYPYGTFDSKGIETINVGDLNVHLAIPIYHKPGRGIPFNYDLGYDSSVWQPLPVNGQPTWQPTQNFGWLAQTVIATGYVSYSLLTTPCDWPPPKRGSITVYSNFIYHDSFGVSHPFDGFTEYDPTHCDTSVTNFTSLANDGSGLTLYVFGNAAPSTTQITTSGGKAIAVPHGGGTNGTVTDSNGNQVSVSGTGVYTDTLGTAAMTVSGVAPSPVTLTYPITGGATKTYTVKYSTYTVTTNFQCSGVVEYSAPNTSLISEIDLPDTTKYLFSYEATPGTTTGAVTGRLTTITLPTGGRISYTYTGGSNGIVCADGGNAGVTRVLNDDPAVSTWTYARTPGSGTSSTAVTDGLGNLSQYSFVTTASAPIKQFYETSRSVYQGTSGTAKLVRQTCYNGAAPPPCTPTSISLPIAQIDTYDTLDGSSQSRASTQKFNSFGLRTEEDVYDFGTAPPGRPLLTKQTWTYPTSGIVSLLSYTYIYDPAGDIIGGNAYFYDETAVTATSGLPQHISVSGQRGNLTSSSVVGGNAGAPTAKYTYDDAGQVLTSKDAALNQTTYAYDSGTGTFPIKTTLPIPSSGVTLASNATYDLNAGVPLTSTDFNGNQTTYSYDNFLRQTSANYPDGGIGSATYNLAAMPATIVQGTLQKTGGSTITNTITLDKYGRTQQTSLTDSSGNDLVRYAYDANGNSQSVTNPYRTTGDPTYGTTSYTYDALGRVTAVTAQDGSPTTYNYAGNAMTVIDPANHQRKIVQDGLGRITQALEPDASNTLNYLTTYQYLQNYNGTAGTYQTIIQQQGNDVQTKWRSRVFTYDLPGRLVQETSPEAGTINYTYPNGGTNCAGNLMWPCSKTDANSTSIAYGYDAVNRLTSKTYSATTPATPNVSFSYDQTLYNGLTIANGKGQRTGMSDGSGQTAWSFDQMARIASVRKTINGITKSASYNYNLDGSISKIVDFSSSGAVVNYTYNNAGAPISATDFGGFKWISGGVYAPTGQLTSMVQGNSSTYAGITTTNSFTKRLQPGVLSASTPAATVLSLSYVFGTAGSNNGNIQQIVNNVDNTRSQTFAYDQLNRLQSAQEGTRWGNTYQYDPWSNLTQKVNTIGNGESISITVNANNQVASLAYDAGGNVTTDNMGNVWTYDAEGRPSTVAGYTYTYDGDGNRVEKSGGPNAALYWPGANGMVLNKTDLAGNTPDRYVYFNGQVAVWLHSNLATHYFLRDHLGSLRATVSPVGTVQDTLDYYPWGARAVGSLTSGATSTFTGDESDTESTSLHTDFRQLNPILGRWLRPDPYHGAYDATNPQSMNRYTYGLNRPLVLTDPSGLCSEVTAGIGSDPTKGGGLALLNLALQNGWDVAFPYAGQSKLSGIFNAFAQSIGFKTGATGVAGAAIQDARTQSQITGGGTLDGAWSAGAIANQASGPLGKDAQLYLSPALASIPTDDTNSLAFSGSGVIDSLVNATDTGLSGYPGTPGAGHDAAAMINGHEGEINKLMGDHGVKPCPEPKVFLPRGYPGIPSGLGGSEWTCLSDLAGNMICRPFGFRSE